MASKEADKATRYVALLYEARCNHRWQDVPELARKVDKHATGRHCLTLAARADALLHTRPGRDGSKEADEQFGEVLSGAIRESANAGDILDASITHASIYYGKQEPELALTQVPEPLHRTRKPTNGFGSEAWLAVCVIRGTLIRGLSFEAQNNQEGATSTYRSIISYVSRVVALEKPCPALRQAAEELITHVCLYFATPTEKHGASMGEAMAAFHVLSQLLSTQSGKFMASRGTFTRNTPRQFWRTYYTALSHVIKGGFVYHPSPLDRDHEAIEHTGLLDEDDFLVARKQQRADLRRVEKSYETILLAETRFPKANETNDEIKQWVELVMGNWRVLCGSSWTSEELGEGGKSGIGRNTLDILYRAQTKTFHSTQILRHLVSVHAYLAEFDLAFKAFDSYVEILTKGKARAKKTGSAGLDLDDDDTAMSLAAEAIRLACRFGSEKAAKKAHNIGLMIQRWLEHGAPDTPVLPQSPTTSKIHTTDEPPRDSGYSDAAVCFAFRSVGISQATWSRYCYDPDMRKALLESAVYNLRTSLRYRSGAAADSTEAFFALGTVQAELGRLEEATTVVGFGLNPPGSSPTSPSKKAVAAQQPANQKFRVDEIGLLPLQHLQALLLSASEDYDASSVACDDALEKASNFGVPGSGHDAGGSFTAVASSMESFDKQNALELKMTQISLAGVLGGSERAINASNELIALYSQLFGPVVMKQAQKQRPETNQSQPKSSSGTIRSLFSRRSSKRMTLGVDGATSAMTSTAPTAMTSAAPSGAPSALPSRPQTMATAPAIHVISETDEDAADPEEAPPATAAAASADIEKSVAPKRSRSLQNKGLDVVKKKGSSRPNTSEGEKRSPLQQPDGSGAQAGGAQPMEDIPHNLPNHEKVDLPAGHFFQPPKQDTRLPVPPPRSENYAPPPQFLYLQEQRFQTGLLIKLWLFIGKLYISSSLFSDADEAVEEAKSLLEELQQEMSREEASVKHLQERGWGGGKSVEDLWADIYAERGNLLTSQSRPHDALLNYEKALTHHPNHAVAITGLANILLDIYEQKIPSEKPDLIPVTAVFSTAALPPSTANGHATQNGSAHPPRHTAVSLPPTDALAQLSQQQSPPTEGVPDTFALYRLAARDRAYGLLASITRLPQGARDAQAWLALARAYELSGQVTEARQALWRVVELEDVAPVRDWGNVGPGGYVLW